MTQLSPVQETIIDQTKDQFETLADFKAMVHTIVSVDHLSVKFLCSDRNVEIRYNEGSDMYDCTVCKFKNYKSPEVYDVEGLFCDQLADLFIE